MTVRIERRRLADAGPARTRTEDDFGRVTLPEADCDTLRDLLIAERARVVIEIGLTYGSSALAIGEALVSLSGLGAKHLIVDPYQRLFENAGGLCTLLPERSQLALPRLVTEGLTADACIRGRQPSLS